MLQFLLLNEATARPPLPCSWMPPTEEWKFKADVAFYNTSDLLCESLPLTVWLLWHIVDLSRHIFSQLLLHKRKGLDQPAVPFMLVGKEFPL